MPNAWRQPRHILRANRDIIYHPARVCDVLRPVGYMAHPQIKTRLELPHVICRPALVSVIRPVWVLIQIIVIIKIKNPPYGGFYFIFSAAVRASSSQHSLNSSPA